MTGPFGSHCRAIPSCTRIKSGTRGHSSKYEKIKCPLSYYALSSRYVYKGRLLPRGASNANMHEADYRAILLLARRGILVSNYHGHPEHHV